MDGIRPVDVVILVLLRDAQRNERVPSMRWLAAELSASTKTPHDSLARLRDLQLIREHEVVGPVFLDLCCQAMRFIAPAIAGPIERGTPTSSSAEPLSSVFPSSGVELAFVWPDGRGDHRGASIEPLHRSVPDIARRRPWFHEEMSLIDGLRMREPRIRREAKHMLEQRVS